MEYIKIDDGTFEEVPEIIKPKRVLIKDIDEQIDKLQLEKNMLVEPSNDELKELGIVFHPYYNKKQKLVDDIQTLKELKQKLQAL